MKTIQDWLDSLPEDLQRKIHLAHEQHIALNKILELHPLDGPRPSYEDYVRREKTLSKKFNARFKLKDLRNVRPGFEPTEVVPNSDFIAEVDIPAGLALFWMMDSGPNYAVCNADRMVWTKLWNNWPTVEDLRKHNQKAK